MKSSRKDDPDWFCIAFYEVSYANAVALRDLLGTLFEIAGTKISALTILHNEKDIASSIDAIPLYLDTIKKDADDGAFSASNGVNTASPRTLNVGYFKFSELGINVFRICLLKQDLIPYLGPLLTAALKVLKCDYGFGLTKPWSTRPDFFLGGFPLGHDSPDHLQLGKTIWRERYKFDAVAKKPLRRYANGYIFGCFEVNIFSAAHLDQISNGATVKSILQSLNIDAKKIGANYAVLLDDKEIEALSPLLEPITLTL